LNLESKPIKYLEGEIICPGDKSISQRILIIGSLLNCNMEIEGFLDAYDPNSTLKALNKIGASIKKNHNSIVLTKRTNAFIDASDELDLGNSGTGVRLMLGLVSGLGINANFIGDSSLSERPMSRVIDPLTEMGALIDSNNGKLPINVIKSNIINSYSYKLPIASAQVKSCLLLAAIASKNDINLIEPKITRDHTERMIEYFGGVIDYRDASKIGNIEFSYHELQPKSNYQIVGDFSSASFIIVASLISNDSEVLIKNVGLNETRSGLLKVLQMMGAEIQITQSREVCNEKVGDILVKSSNLEGIEVPDSIIPNIIDEIPILSIAAIFAKGKTIIKNASELKVKESDRLSAISNGLDKLNISHELFDDGLSIHGNNDVLDTSEVIDSYGDHRIAMSFLIAGVRTKNGLMVKNCGNIKTSFPSFRDIMNSIGMKINEKN
jgi:3-phosphoshikimate 1-carboxyvinyltransferase